MLGSMFDVRVLGYKGFTNAGRLRLKIVANGQGAETYVPEESTGIDSKSNLLQVPIIRSEDIVHATLFAGGEPIDKFDIPIRTYAT
jgi:hypothetical protein